MSTYVHRDGARQITVRDDAGQGTGFQQRTLCPAHHHHGRWPLSDAADGPRPRHCPTNGQLANKRYGPERRMHRGRRPSLSARSDLM